MGNKRLVLVSVLFCLVSLSDSATVLRQFNASDYVLKNGTVYSGTISDTNVSDAASFGILEAAYANSTGGMASFQLSASATIAQYQRWLGNGWTSTAAASTPATAGTLRYLVVKANPIRDEKILATLDSNSDVDAQVWNGSEWSATTEMTAIASIATKRAFDVAFEQLSGRGLVVYANTTTATIAYRIWNGSGFSAQGGLGIGTAGVTNRIIDLIAKSDSNQIMLLVSEGSATPDLRAILWNGTEFNTSTQVTITTELDTTSDEQSYSGDWEESSGDFNVFYGNDASLTILKNTFSNGVWVGQSTGASGGDGDVRYVKVATFPGTDRQMVCWKEWTAGDVNCQSWDGSNFQGTGNDNATEVGAVGRNFDVAPMLGSNGGFVLMYGDLNDDWFDFMVCTSGANCDSATWATRTLWATTQLGGVDTRWGQIYADPYNFGNFTLLGVSQTAANGWFRARIFCDAAACSLTEAWTNFGGTTSVVFESAFLTFDKHKFYRGEVWHNSTRTAVTVPASKIPNFINVTARINATVTANYSLNIYDWVNANWNVCTQQILQPNVFSSLVCNITSSPANYRSQDADRYVRIAINGTYNHTVQAVLEDDFLQFYLGFGDDPPYYDFSAGKLGVTNSTPMPGQNITFYSLWYDDTSLGQFWLEHNGSGTFVNEAPLAFPAANDSWGNYSLIVPGSAEGKQFSARIWANDSVGGLNLTSNFTITVENVKPAVGNTTVNATTAAPWQSVCVNASATDVGIGINVTWALVTYPNGTTSNITLSDTGCNAGIAGDGRYGALINVSGIEGNFTVNTTFANDSRNNLNMQSPFPQLGVMVRLPPNPIGGSNFYVGFYGNATGRVVNKTAGPLTLYENKIPNGTLYVAKEGAVVSWGRLKVASNVTDMPNMDVDLDLTASTDKLETNYNLNISATCGIQNLFFLNSTDGNFHIGLLYSDENSNDIYNTGDNIIFCTDFNPNSINYLGDRSDYEIVFPRSFASTVDVYFDA
ncbi:MAG: hypothetical protein AABX01_01245 [Candidatus Micrarchaeota archaeon]